jgi:hypothetical protein
MLVWGQGCGAGVDYTIHEGDLTTLLSDGVYAHSSKVCHDAGGDLQETFAPGAGDRYFLVVPRTAAGIEGDFGPGRPPGTDAAGCGVAGHDATACP